MRLRLQGSNRGGETIRMVKRNILNIALMAVALPLVCRPVFPQSDEDLAKQPSNSVAALISVSFQFN
ncbi:hypothetical protein [Paraburkholderia fynbosensis]|uniref:Uncharacterized protein n=1 Tax=Paraburkholderia fynbosensis TaxID=1200993 RepID=A0A6J5H0K0_9BURK|nr:hypothetical protein [Paraburkholderia fynbosensis]CAB3809618.1 hypothetical protein LMG27177_06853 [Paraburkholderia fynbosensis]